MAESIPVGYEIIEKEVRLRGGRTLVVRYVGRVAVTEGPAELKPADVPSNESREELEAVDADILAELQSGDSIREAFRWIVTTDTFMDEDGGQFFPDDEARADEIGIIYTYALNEGISESMVDALYRQALEGVDEEVEPQD